MRPLHTSRTEQEVFADLEALCCSSGYIHVLANISVQDNFIAYKGPLTSEHLAASYVPERTVRSEFTTLLGLMMKGNLDLSPPTKERMEEQLEQTTALLHELHVCLNAPIFEAMKGALLARNAGKEVTSPFGRGDVLREPIFYGGESAFNFQYREFAAERYARDDAWLEANKGFRIADGQSLAIALSRLQARKLRAHLDQTIANPGHAHTYLPGFSFTLSEIAKEAALSETVAEAVLTALTAPPSPTNAGFVSLSDFNLAQAQSIILTPSREYVALQAYGVTEALYDSPFYWMASDRAYKGTAFTHRGAFTEGFVARRLMDVFGAKHVYRNVNIYSKDRCITEVDVLVLFADRAMVIQCKSKKLTLESRRGNDFQLRDDFKKSVQDAYDQAYLCAKSMGDPTLRFALEDGTTVEIPKITEIYPICVVSDHYPALTVQAREFLKVETSDHLHPPLVTDVFLIDVLCEMLSSPLRLLSYVNRRVNYGHRIQSIQELTILGYHLSHNLWLNNENDLVMLADDLSMPLDTAMTVRREGVFGEATPKGILTQMTGTRVGRILGAIENQPDPALVDLGFMILTLDGDTLDDLNKGLNQVASATKEDGRLHDFTIAFEKGDSGLTLHCSRSSNSDALEALLDHCRRRKYIHQADGWFGLVIREDDGLPKFGVNLKSPWAKDKELDELIKGMPVGKAMRRRAPAIMSGKVGRNAPCPCRSGMKFKKCCMK